MTQRIVIVTLLTILASLGLNCATAAKPRVSVVAVKAQAAEKNSINGQFQLVTDAPVSKALTVSYAVGGSAKGGKDYKKIKPRATIRAGQSVVNVDVIPVADKKAEKPETVKLTIKNGRNYLRGNARFASIQITDEPVSGRGGGTGSASGTLYWANGFFTASSFNLATGEKKDVARFSLDSQGQLGYGGGLFTEVESTGILPEYITVNLRDVAPNPYTLRSKLSTFPLNGFTNGPVQPSPDGRLFALATSESRGLGEERGLYVYVFDAALNIVFKLEGYQSRAWLGNDRVVVVRGSNLYTVTVTNSPVVTRIGPDGLGLPNEDVSQPSVSPDGTAVAYVQGDAIWRINVDGSGLMQLTKPYIGAEWPSWSPDGSSLVITTDCHVGQLEVNSSYTPFHIISATQANQDRDAIRPITFACGPVYWLP